MPSQSLYTLNTSEKTLLLVEDEAIIAMDEAQTLKKYGFKVITVHNGNKAVEAVEKNSIDLILMDIDLGSGKMDGTQTAEVILKDYDIPLVFLSNHTEPEVVENTEKISAFGYVVKNTGETVLVNSIKMAFRLFEERRKSQRNEKMLKAALDNSQAGIAIAEAPSGTLRYVNDAGLLIRGSDRERVVEGIGVDQYVSKWKIKDLDGTSLETDEVPLTRAIAYGEKNSRQFIVEREDHSDRIVMANAAPIFDECGNIDSAIVVFLDVTEHKQTEQELYHKNEMLKRTEHIAHVGGWEWEVESDIVTWSEELYHIAGLDPDKPPPQFNEDHYKIYTKESWQKLTSVVGNCLKTGTPYEINAQMVRPNGEIRDVFIYGGVRYGTDNSITGLFGIVQDITNTIRMEEELKQKEENLRITLQSIGDAVIATDINGYINQMNPIAETLTGWKLSLAKGKPLKEVFQIKNANTGEKSENPVKRVLETGKIVGLANHTKLISKKGKEYQIADSAAPIKDAADNLFGVVLVFRDVTEEYQIRNTLQAKEERLSSLFNSMTEGVCLHELVYDEYGKAINYRIIDVNKAYENILNLERKDVIEKLATEAYGAEQPPYLEIYAEVTKTTEPYKFETYYPPMDQHFFISVISIGEDRFATVFMDITELKEARNKLKQQKDFIEQIAETSPITITKVNREGKIVYANTKAEEVLGLEKNQIKDRTYNDVKWKITKFDGGEFPVSKLPFEQVRKTGKSVYDIQHAIEWPDGERKLLSINASPLFDAKGQFDGMVVSISDITEQYQTEQNLKKALEEKDFLMKELNHRIKNNLGMIKSLINLRNTATKGTAVQSDIINQIDAFRIVHEKLYQSSDNSMVDVKDYLIDLLRTIFDSYTIGPVEIKDNIDRSNISSNTAIPLGLIINEIATNAIKHGFLSEKKKEFSISFIEENEGTYYVLTLSNTGVPFPDDISLENPDSLGLQLVTSLVNQLDGTLDIVREPSAEFIIKIPKTSNSV